MIESNPPKDTVDTIFYPKTAGVLVLDGVGTIVGCGTVEEVGSEFFRVQRDERGESSGRAVRFLGNCTLKGASRDEVPVDAGGKEERVAVVGLFAVGMLCSDVKSRFAVGGQAGEGILGR